MSQCRLWGISLIVVSLLKAAMSPMFGVQPDPVNAAITIAALGAGCVLVLRSYGSAQDVRLQTDVPHRTGKRADIRSQGVETARRSAK